MSTETQQIYCFIVHPSPNTVAFPDDWWCSAVRIAGRGNELSELKSEQLILSLDH